MPATASSDSCMTLVLLPGMDGSGELFAPFIAAMGSRFRVIAIRYPVTGPQHYDALASHVRHQVQSEASFALLAESFAGPIAVSLAAERPAGLKGLILCATFASNPQPLIGAAKGLARLLPARLPPIGLIEPLLFDGGDKALRATLVRILSEVGPHILRDRLRAVIDVDVTAELVQVDVPCLYLQAARDRLVPSSAIRPFASHLPHMQIERISAPHFLLQSTPIEAAGAVTRFLDGLK